MGKRDEVQRLYEKAGALRAEIEALWNDAQLTDVLMKGAVSAAQEQGLSDHERGSAVTIGLQNAQKWRRLAALSEQMGALLEEIEQAKSQDRP